MKIKEKYRNMCVCVGKMLKGKAIVVVRRCVKVCVCVCLCGDDDKYECI